MYAYGHVGYLMAGIAGQANGTPDAKYSGGWEEAYAGVVGGGSTASGTSWQYNVSYGLQSYCIGGAMLLCQIAGSSGDRAGDFTWPRWSGRNFLKAQFRDQQHHGRRLPLRAERLPAQPHADRGRERCSTTRATAPRTGSRGSRCSTPTRCTTCPRARPCRATACGRCSCGRATRRPPGTPARSARWSGRGRRTRTSTMSAIGAGVEGGWSFARTKWAPTITYRWTTLGGDDPSTRDVRALGPVLLRRRHRRQSGSTVNITAPPPLIGTGVTASRRCPWPIVAVRALAMPRAAPNSTSLM